MVKDILSSVYGALAVVFLIAVLMQGTALNQYAYAQQLPQPEGRKDDPLSKAVEVLGGLNTVNEVKTQLIKAEGNRFEPGQKFEPIEQPLPVSNFSYYLAQNLDELR